MPLLRFATLTANLHFNRHAPAWCNDAPKPGVAAQRTNSGPSRAPCACNPASNAG
jgi:hypothetical protein